MDRFALAAAGTLAAAIAQGAQALEIEPLKFKQDIFDPLGDRITIISDFKKPIKEDSQRMLLAVALEDTKAFQNTLNKLIALTGGQPKKREFQSTTIYDFEMPAMPNAGAKAADPAATGAVQAGGRSAWPSPRTRCSSPPSRPCSSWCSAAAAPAWPTARRTRRLPGRCPARSAA